MDILVAIIIIAAIAGIIFAWVQRRHASSPGVKRPGTQPFPRRRRGVVARHDPMAAAVAEHAQAMDPAEVVVAEQRLQAEARSVSARMQSGQQPNLGAAPAAYAPPPDGAYPGGYDAAPGEAYAAGYEPVPGQAYAPGQEPVGGQAYPPGQVPVGGQAYPAGQQPVRGQVSPTGPAVPIATDPSLDDHFDPVTGERIDGYDDPANDPRLNDRRYDGRLAADWVDPGEDDRIR
jgi:hypothetical protein